jgi:APA family basic amino acid/polyamine antiporter
LVPIVPLLGALVCAGMIVAIDLRTLKFAAIWMVIGIVVYLLYSRKHSKLGIPNKDILPTADDFEPGK